VFFCSVLINWQTRFVFGLATGRLQIHSDQTLVGEKSMKKLSMGIMLSGMLFIQIGCSEEAPVAAPVTPDPAEMMEHAAESMHDAADHAEHAADKAGEAIEGAADKAGEAIDGAADKAGEAVEGAADAAKEAVAP
jgi:hypothetical protein